MAKEFKKGEDPRRNTKGRPKGSLNRLSRDMKITIIEFLEDRWPEVVNEFDKLKGRDKIKIYLELLSYGVPKMQAVQMEIDFETLPDSQLEFIINSLLNTQSNETDKRG